MGKATTSARRARKGSPTVHLEEGDTKQTSHAGLVPVVRFLDGLGLDGLFRQYVPHQRSGNAEYGLSDGLFLVMIGLIAGARSLRHCVALWADGALRRVAGWLRIPDETTVGRLFKEVSARQVSGLEALNHALRHRIWERARSSGAAEVGGPGTLWVDIDSTVKTVHGRQEGAAKGYNPHKPGARSYHPLLAFCASTKEILQGWQRPGDAHTGNGAVGFAHQLLAQTPAHQRVVIRADSGFFNGALLDALEEAGQGFLIKAKQTRGLKRHLSTASWRPVPHRPGWEQCTEAYGAHGWSQRRTVVAVRYRQEPEADPAQATLFGAERYQVFAYVTSEDLTPWQAHRRYGQRATSETWIEEAKNHMGLGHLKTDRFWANAALFQCAILAYNTLRWMALQSGNRTLQKWEPRTIRAFLIRLGGRLVTGGNQLRVKLAHRALHPELCQAWRALAPPS